MEPDFWRARWRNKQIGFNQAAAHPQLVRHAERFPPGSRIFVPLAGKSVDMAHLVEKGFEVVGVELVESAVQEFFEEQGWTPEVDRSGPHPIYRSQSVELHVADVFTIAPKNLGKVGAVYDRASVIALPPELRARYAAHLAMLLPGDVGVLMITVEYDPSVLDGDGPPFPVPPAEIHAIFGGPFEVFLVESDRDALEPQSSLRKRGLSALTEHVLWLRRRA